LICIQLVIATNSASSTNLESTEAKEWRGTCHNVWCDLADDHDLWWLRRYQFWCHCAGRKLLQDC